MEYQQAKLFFGFPYSVVIIYFIHLILYFCSCLLHRFIYYYILCVSDEKIALLGAIQSLFEGSMYTFVFLWTPALSPNDEEIPHGFIFATFMLSSMLGSSLASKLMARSAFRVESYMQIVFVVSSASLTLPILTTVCYSSNIFSPRSPQYCGLHLIIFCNILTWLLWNSSWQFLPKQVVVVFHSPVTFSCLASVLLRVVLAYSGHPL